MLVSRNIASSTAGRRIGMRASGPLSSGASPTGDDKTPETKGAGFPAGAIRPLWTGQPEPRLWLHVAVELSEEKKPAATMGSAGFAYCFVALPETADFFYKCDELDSPNDEKQPRGGLAGDQK
jgi:hypothetical protein